MFVHLSEIIPKRISDTIVTTKKLNTLSLRSGETTNWDQMKRMYKHSGGAILSKSTGKYCERQNFRCKICLREFSRIYEAIRHELTVHSAKVRCIYCSKSLKVANRRDLQKRHLLTKCPIFAAYKMDIKSICIADCFK
eukprot:NODE_53_length_30760_cov_1.203712.p15 type:complete len:138 gc:universal NODE_53_length_30760_cov_1.203712:24289-23876(-)